MEKATGEGTAIISGEYLTPQQAAAKKGVALASIYKAIERGQIPAARVLGRVALLVADVEAYTPGTYTRAGGETLTRAAIKRGPGRGKTAAAAAAEGAKNE